MTVRIFKTLLFIPDLIRQLLLHIITDLFGRGAFIDLSAAFKHFDLQLFKRAADKAAPLPVFERIHIIHRAGGVDHFIGAGKILRHGFAGFIIHAVDLFQAGVGGLFYIFRHFDLRHELIALLKETSVAGYVAVVDLTRAGNLIRNNTYDAFNPLMAVALIYLVFVVGLTKLLGKLEQRLRKSDRT